jgi:hypothetical protein
MLMPSYFALDDGRTIIMFGAPSAVQLADGTVAKDSDRQAIVKLSSARDLCFRRLQSVNPDPLGPMYYNGMNVILARLYNREMTFGQANQIGAGLTSERGLRDVRPTAGRCAPYHRQSILLHPGGLRHRAGGSPCAARGLLAAGDR